MHGPGRRWAVVVCLAACLAACATTTGPGAVTPPPSAGATPVRVLQLNLCNSGIAGCFTGRSTAVAAAAIRAGRPDLVTLNEVCRDDVAVLGRALAEVVPGGGVSSAFQPARDGRNGEPYRCRNGDEYGIGLVSRWPPVPRSSAGGGIYPAQDRDDPEQRAWLCRDVAATPEVAVCTTHLAYTKREVARAQCRYLFGAVVAGMRARDGAVPVVLGGDLNLGNGDSPDLKACLPAGSALVDDGGPQHVIATPEFVVDDFRRIDLLGSTDHPGLLVTLGPRTSAGIPPSGGRSTG
jgi:endonuclease/exonuclease/phosphatase family metal-dependent hydrolase